MTQQTTVNTVAFTARPKISPHWFKHDCFEFMKDNIESGINVAIVSIYLLEIL